MKHLIFVLIGLFCLSAFAKEENKKFFLNYQELLQLNLEDRVEYLDNALDYVTLTEISSSKEKKKSAAEPFAGTVCRKPDESHSKECGARLACNPSLFSLTTPVCVNKGSCETVAQNCLAEFRKLRSKGVTPDEFDSWAQTASQELTKIHPTRTDFASMEQRCAKESKGEDCKYFHQLKEKLVAAHSKADSVKKKHDERIPAADPVVWTPTPSPAPRAYSNSAALGSLSCVASGLGEQASEFIALMGVAAQTYDGPLSREKLVANVIERISSYGYCTDSEFRSGALSGGGADQIRRIIEGEQPMTSGWWIFRSTNRDLADSTFASFGIYGSQAPYISSGGNGSYVQPAPSCGFWARLFGRCQKAQPNYSAAYANQMFNDVSYSQPVQRQVGFRSQTQGFHANFPHTPFAGCVRAIQARGQKNSGFRMCDGKNLSKKAHQSHTNLANRLYQACGLPVKKRVTPKTCPEQCHDSYAFGTQSSWLKGCSPARYGDGGGNNPSGHGPGGKGGEGGGEGRGDSGGGGKGGEADGGGRGGDGGGFGGGDGGPGAGAGPGSSGGEGGGASR